LRDKNFFAAVERSKIGSVEQKGFARFAGFEPGGGGIAVTPLGEVVEGARGF
jgi:hypothetical protein